MLKRVVLGWRLAAAAVLVALACTAGAYAATSSSADAKEGTPAKEEAATNAGASDTEKATAEKDEDEGFTIGDILADAVETPAWVTGELADCGVCHTRTADNPENDGYLYASHTIVSCFACHDDADTLAKRHENATQAKGEKLKKLKKTEVNVAVCAICHDPAALVEKTADCIALTDKDGNVVNPHDVSSNARHDENVTCSSCHKFHKDLEPQAQAFNFCIGCHHAAVFECGTCHD